MALTRLPVPGFQPAVRALLRSFLLAAVLAGCGGSNPFQVSSDASGDLSVIGRQGPTPFIAYLDVSGANVGSLDSVTYQIQPRSGSASKPVQVSYSFAALQARNDVTETTLTIPVFGLYADTQNQATLHLVFTDGSSRDVQAKITTPSYEDPDGIYDHPTILQARAAGSALGYDFVALKSTRASVVVIDTDGAVRWIGTGVPSASTIFTDNGFVVGAPTSGQIERLELDGTVTSSQVDDQSVSEFTHNIDPGKSGLLAEFDTPTELGATVEEITSTGSVLMRWSLGDLLSQYMSSHGDDPSTFVRPGTDWFHINATTYDPRDDSLIVSSRENFVIKLDYATGAPIWILGDPTKYWYTFPSLRQLALTVADGGFYPIGQHATSITDDGLLMVFNDGTASDNQPSGAPAGQSRSYAVVSAYDIDPVAMTAQETWRYEHQPDLDSSYCSSSYEAGGSYLVNYALAANGTTVRVIGLDPNRQVVFDISYPTSGCQTSWNAIPVPFDDLQFQ